MKEFEAQKTAVVNTSSTTKPTQINVPEPAPKPATGKEDYLAKKEREKMLRKLKSNVEKSEQRVQELENQLSEIQAKLQLPENQTDMDLFTQYDTIKLNLEKEMAYWEDATMQYEEAM